MPDGSTTAHIYRPKIATVLAEGYDLDCFRKDMLAALTVAIVALPLSMAIAVASGVSPERGLYAAVIGGFLVSALGGSRYQIGGPAGAFIVLVAATVTKFGLDGLLLTVFLSGFMLTLIGLLRLGSLIRYIPHAVTVGFTCGIAVTIFASQLKVVGAHVEARRLAIDRDDLICGSWFEHEPVRLIADRGLMEKALDRAGDHVRTYQD
jgi:sulfate permease, SulP family